MSSMRESHALPKLFRDRADYRTFHSGEEQALVAVGLLYAALLTALVIAWWATTLDSLVAAIPISIVAFVVIGWAQYSIGNGLHEAVHHNLRNRKTKGGDRFAAFLTAYPIGLTMNYRRVHLLHHRYVGTDRDPEFDTYNCFPKSKPHLAWRLLCNFSGIPAMLQFLKMTTGRYPGISNGSRAYDEIAGLVLVQAIIAAVFWLTFGNPIYYVVFWILPLAMVGKFLSSTRLLCEHGSPHHVWVVRTIDGHRWQTWLMGAFDFNYHGEHHLFPSVPYARLENLHRRHEEYRAANPEYVPFGGRFETFQGGYLKLLAHWFRTLPWRASADARH